MLAATSARSDRTLDTVRLVLLMEANEQKYPDTLNTYFKEVIGQALSLLKNPSDFASKASAEAVSLALTISSNNKLREIIERVLEENKISQVEAEEALENLEVSFDPNREPAHFSKNIYATI